MADDAGMDLYRSNRTEVLADRLADLMGGPVEDPMVRELLVVQGRGMAVWLSQQLARRHGVWTACEFLYPRNFVQRMVDLVLGEPESLAFGRDELLWAILGLLPMHLEDPAFAPLRDYVAADGDPHGLRRFQLARNVAATFDEYVTYRPELVTAWETGRDGPLPEEQRWQPILWRALVERCGRDHVANRVQRCLEALSRDDRPPLLPARVAVFGLSSLPPLYVRVIAALARHVGVHVFLPTPTRHSWSDLCRAAEIRRVLRTSGAEAIELETLHLDVGHPLLGSLGGVGADFVTTLESELESAEVHAVEPPDDLFEAAEGDTVLATLQRDVLELRHRSPAGDEPRRRIDPDDDSIRLCACHSPMREVEVLHDQLLAMLDEDDGPRPQDIVVMTPDVETYAPLIEAVFDREPGDPRAIRYRIADRSVRSDAPVIEALHALLSMVGSRITASGVLDLLHLEAIAGRLGIAQEDVDRLTQWTVEAGIRWGIDAAHRERHGQPRVEQNTWRFGLDRLLLGYAMPGGGREMFAGTLPYDEIEGQDAELVGRLAEFCERLFFHVQRLEQPRTLARWREVLAELLEALVVSEGEAAWQHQKVDEAMQSIAAAAQSAGFDGELHLQALRPLLDPELDDAHPARGFLDAGVTFCAMLPMRSVPFPVVCMLGMNDRAFPRSARPVDFDLVARAPRRGDRSRRADDRYLFLEALLAARRRVLITYVGQSVQDGSPIPPSVVVSELLDALVDGFDPPVDAPDEGARAAAVVDHVRVRHPLQPFSRRYFDASDARLFSYADNYLEGARSLGPERAPPAPFFTSRLPEADAEARKVSLAELCRFFEGPTRYLLNRRLGLVLRDQADDVSDREPLELDGLERYGIGEAILDAGLHDVELARSLPLLRASGRLPLGTPGDRAHAVQVEIVRPILERVREHRAGGRLPSLVVNHDLPDGTRLTGQLTDRYASGLLRHQLARVASRHLLSLWVRHLALCWLAPAEGERRSWLVGRGAKQGMRTCVIAPVEDPASRLGELLELYRAGQREPLLLFPDPSLAYCKKHRETGDADEGMDAAQRAWASDRFPDDHVLRVYGQDQPLPTRVPGFLDAPDPALSFDTVARTVFEPLLAHLDEVKG